MTRNPPRRMTENDPIFLVRTEEFKGMQEYCRSIIGHLELRTSRRLAR